MEIQLIDLYLESGQIEKARDLHLNLKGAIDHGQWLRLQAEILEYKGDYQDAIDVIESIPDRRDFKERHTSTLSYLELKMGAPAKALKRCKEFLEQRSFSLHFETEIINYEYAKKLDKNTIDKKRVAAVGEKTESEMVKAVCSSLLGNDKETLAIFNREGEKRFSVVDDCLRWPVFSRHLKEMKGIRDDLLKAKRAFNDFPG